MSHDQRPGKVRVVAGNAQPAVQRRRDDPADSPASPAGSGSGSAPGPNAAFPTPGTGMRMSLIGILLFLIGCASGGAALALLVSWG